MHYGQPAMPMAPSDPMGFPPVPPAPTQPLVPSFNPVVNQPPATSVSSSAPPTIFNPAVAVSAAPVAPAASHSTSGVVDPSSPAPNVPSYQMAPPPNFGWNDPPSAAALAAAKKPNQSSNLRKVKPTKPAVTPMELPAGMLNPAAFVPQQHHQNPMAPPPFSGAPAPLAPAPAANTWMAPNTAPPPTNGFTPAPAPVATPAPVPPPVAPPAAPVVKKAIPAVYQMLFDTFANALTRCQGATKNPVMKRKLDDVSKKLEILADKLRESGVSPNVLTGLQQMASAVEIKDYQNGLKVYALIVRGGNFAEISSFMPGLKTLMQSATQLRV